MKFVALVCLALFVFGNPVRAQNIARAEYFFDTDPGIGAGNAIPLNGLAGQDVNKTLQIPLNMLSTGVHTLGMRTLANNGKWSQTSWSSFVKIQQPTGNNLRLVTLSTDSAGLVQTFALASQTHDSLKVNYYIAGLTTGMHSLWATTTNSGGVKGLTSKIGFIRKLQPNNQPLKKFVYALNSDPSTNGQQINYLASKPAIDSFPVNLSLGNLSNGVHSLQIRSLDSLGIAGPLSVRTFIKRAIHPDSNKMLGGEYAYDTDPGVGNGTRFNFTLPAPNIANFLLNADLTTLSTGKHLLIARTRDRAGSWSLTDTAQFYKQLLSIAPNKTITAIVFPNPATEKVNIIFSEELEIEELKLTDVLGIEVKEAEFSPLHGRQFGLNTDKLSSGTYFIALKGKGFINRLKLIKK